MCNEPDGLGGSGACSSTACNGNYHVYTLVVNQTAKPQFLQYSIDGVNTQTITQTTLGQSIWNQTVHNSYCKSLLPGIYVSVIAAGDSDRISSLDPQRRHGR